jgi:hypothetical protein
MRPITLPRDRKSLTWLYILCAHAQGVRTVLTDGRVTGFTGPAPAVRMLEERLRRLDAPPPHPAQKAHRQAVERWRHRQKRGR